ncbi:hypothetical protein [Leifsonia sp. A12D58]|uniref:hypothetical protein n=1 Tax=Leifsonia sp. A12D58 TaxID=3397674 RepID=UPI0039E19C85
MRIADARRVDGPSTARVAAVALLVVLVGSLLSGCASTTEPQPTPTPTATDAVPVFASDEEALAAATEAYAAYLEADDRSWSGNPESIEVFLQLTTGEAHNEDVSIRALYAKNGWTRIGSTSISSMELQSHGVNSDGLAEIRTYVCLDVSGADVLDSEGKSASKPDRPLVLPLEVAFLSNFSPESPLQLSESRVWSGQNFC